MAEPTPTDLASLRAEHDALAETLAIRASVDHVQRGGVFTFFTVLSFGMTAKLGWDRWGWLPRNRPPPEPGLPMYFLIALLLSLTLLTVAARAFQRASRIRLDEDARFHRLLALRARLGLDA
jgi:hypothetical protein